MGGCCLLFAMFLLAVFVVIFTNIGQDPDEKKPRDEVAGPTPDPSPGPGPQGDS